MFAEVALSISTFQTFIYKVPKNLIDNIQIGLRVKVNVGNRSVSGVIISINKKTDYIGQIKPISEIIDDSPILTNEIWLLIKWISYYYVTPIGKVFNMVLPLKLSSNYVPPTSWHAKLNDKINNDLISYLKTNAPTQYKIYIILKASYPESIIVSSLDFITPNPLAACKSLSKKKIVHLIKEERLLNPRKLYFEQKDKIIDFNNDQKKVLRILEKNKTYNSFKCFLLHGVTGSGKTEIFISMIKRVIKSGKAGILLLPEIALTPQIAGRFISVFGEQVALWHSQLNGSQRKSTWSDIVNGKYKIVIGARSAIFSPIKNVGIIIVDEEHDASYKQSSPAPRYNARDVAIMRAKFEKSIIILSSATPSLESYINYKKGKYKYLNLPNRYGGANYPKIKIIDLIEEKEETGKANIIFSSTLLDKIEDRLNKKEQILLIQNRRGYSPSVKCIECGEIIMCKACKTTLTYHKNDNKMKCHLCGYSEISMEMNCKSCNGNNLIYIGTGTQKVEKQLKMIFPEAIVARIDQDTTKNKNEIAKLLESFSKGGIDILLGTQMIAKGLDFPKITLVGIINADLGIHFPDFRSGERTFQLIYQAAGRSGRGNKKGEVVIQTYDKSNPIIKSAAKLDLIKFYEHMLLDRKLLNYPPYSWITKVEFSGYKFESVFNLASKTKDRLSYFYKGLEILGPASCFFSKLKNKYRFQIIFKSNKKHDSNGEKLHLFIRQNFFGKEKFKYGSNKVIIDVDPITMV